MVQLGLFATEKRLHEQIQLLFRHSVPIIPYDERGGPSSLILLRTDENGPLLSGIDHGIAQGVEHGPPNAVLIPPHHGVGRDGHIDFRRIHPSGGQIRKQRSQRAENQEHLPSADKGCPVPA